MNPKIRLLTIFSFLFFIAYAAVGITMAGHKPIWQDEIYSQKVSVEKKTYVDILQGKIEEGNNSPLFYTIQKVLCDAFRYRFPHEHKGQDSIYDRHAQIFLRLPSIIFMSLAMVTVFVFFVHFQGWMAGLYASLLFNSSFILWQYMAEARPYALWVFLTVLQIIMSFRAMNADRKEDVRSWKGLGLVHFLLSLTSVFGTVQAVLGSVLMWVGGRMRTPGRWAGLLALPLITGLFYFAHSPKYAFHVHDFIGLIEINVSFERLAVLAAYPLVFLAYAPWRKGIFRTAENLVWLFFAGLLAASALLIVYYSFPHAIKAPLFRVETRYFLNLAPVSALAVAFIAARCFRWPVRGWGRWNMHLALWGLLVIESYRTYLFLFGFFQW